MSSLAMVCAPLLEVGSADAEKGEPAVNECAAGSLTVAALGLGMGLSAAGSMEITEADKDLLVGTGPFLASEPVGNELGAAVRQVPLAGSKGEALLVGGRTEDADAGREGTADREEADGVAVRPPPLAAPLSSSSRGKRRCAWISFRSPSSK
jgi:hypothetical protein